MGTCTAGEYCMTAQLGGQYGHRHHGRVLALGPRTPCASSWVGNMGTGTTDASLHLAHAPLAPARDVDPGFCSAHAHAHML
eukprot:364060-Chlamydomonas_euryale.AAC.4